MVVKIIKDNACTATRCTQSVLFNFIIVDIWSLQGYHLLAIQIQLWDRFADLGGKFIGI